MRKQFSFASLVCLPLLACGGSNNNSKTVKTVDGKAADAAAACAAAASYPMLGNMGYGLDFPATMNGSQTIVHGQVMVETLNTTDVVFLQLNAQFGGFGSGDIKAGTYALAGDDLDPTACGLCFYVWPKSLNGTTLNVNSAYFMTEQYMAVSGSITLTQAGGSANGSNLIAGTVSNVTFKHATIASDGSLSYNADGCTTSVGSGSFGYKLQMGSAGSAAFAGDSEIHANGFDMPADAVKLRHRTAE